MVRSGVKDAPINAYEPDSKKSKQDINWIQQLEQLPEEPDLHACLMSMESQDVMEFNFTLELNSHRQQKMFLRNPTAFLVKKMRCSGADAQRSNEVKGVLFTWMPKALRWRSTFRWPGLAVSRGP